MDELKILKQLNLASEEVIFMGEILNKITSRYPYIFQECTSQEDVDKINEFAKREMELKKERDG